MTYVRIVSKSATSRQQDVPPVFVAPESRRKTGEDKNGAQHSKGGI